MQNIDIVIIVLFAIAAIRKILFWAFVMQLKEYRFDRFYDYMLTKDGKKAIFNIFDLAETVLFLIFVYIVFAEISFDLLVEILLVLLVVEVLYFLFKIIKRRFIYPKLTFRIKIILFLSLIFNAAILALFFYSKYYFVIMLLLLSNQIVVIYIASSLISPIVNRKKHKIMQNAKKRLKDNSMIKIGITGSFGKSSMKEYLNLIFSSQYNTIASPENINTEIGVSNFVLSNIDKTYEYFFCEMGAYKIGEINVLGDIVNHKYGFLTGIGNQHIALFGNINNTIKAKFEIINKVLENKGKLYVNIDNEHIQNYLKETGNKKLSGSIISYGIQNQSADAISHISQLKNSGTSFEFEYKRKRYKFETNLIGKHNVLNLTGAIAFAIDNAIDIDHIAIALKNLKAPKHTLEIIDYSDKTVFIDDTYNLSVDGLKSGVEVLQFYDKSKILVLDDVLELGYESIVIHKYIGKQLANAGIDKILLIGKSYSRFVEKGLIEGGFDYKNIIKTNYVEKLNQFKNEGSVILFEGKGTRRLLKEILVG